MILIPFLANVKLVMSAAGERNDRSIGEVQCMTCGDISVTLIGTTAEVVIVNSFVFVTVGFGLVVICFGALDVLRIRLRPPPIAENAFAYHGCFVIPLYSSRSLANCS